MSDKNQNNPVGAIVGFVMVGAIVWFYFGGGLERKVQKDMRQIEQQVAADVVQQYEIAKRSGNAIDAYVHASLVAAAYLQAKDEPNYQKWKTIEAEEAVLAKMPKP